MAARRSFLYCRGAMLSLLGRWKLVCGIQRVPAALRIGRLLFRDIRNRTGRAIGLTLLGSSRFDNLLSSHGVDRACLDRT